jgi:hypothetical protein
MSEQAAPGWYPVDERTERWWDGIQWSEHQRPLAQGQVQPPPQRYQPRAYDQPADQGPSDPYGRPPQYFGQQAPYGQAPVYGQPAPKRSVGRVVAAVVVAFLGVIFSLAALSNIANAGDGARGVGYLVGSLLIPAALWAGFWFLIRRPGR